VAVWVGLLVHLLHLRRPARRSGRLDLQV